MTSKNRLISLLVAGAMAISSIVGLTGCNDGFALIALEPYGPERKSLTTDIALDAKQQFFNVVYFDIEVAYEKCYIKFLGHYDNGNVKTYNDPYGHDTYEYVDHKDYLITYEISKEECKNIMMFYSNANSRIRYLTLENLSTLQSIVDNYDPISVEESTIDVQRKEHSY